MRQSSVDGDEMARKKRRCASPEMCVCLIPFVVGVSPPHARLSPKRSPCASHVIMHAHQRRCFKRPRIDEITDKFVTAIIDTLIRRQETR